MRHREKGRRLPDIDVLARGFLRRGLSEHPDAAKHVANVDDIENMSAWELLNLAKTMGVDPAAMIRSLEQEDDKRWTYSHHNPGFTGELEFDLVLELLGRKVTRKAKIAYTHTPEWEYWDRLKQAPYTGWASSSWQIELQAVPQEQDEDGNWVDLEPYWMQLEELTRDDIIPTEVWDVLLDAVDDKCRAEDAERCRIAAAKATSPAKTSRRRH
jgi:hypothetical protein